MTLSLQPFYPILIAATLLLSACERTVVCTEPAAPAFPESYRGLLPTSSGEVLSFTDGVRNIDFSTTVSETSPAIPARRYNTPESLPCELPPSAGLAQAKWEAQSIITATHPAIRFQYNACYGDTTVSQYGRCDSSVSLQWTIDRPVVYFRYYPTLGNPAQGDSVALNLQLGTRSYGRVVVLTADTLQSYAPDVWRVYFANPGGIVGFESRYTRSLFWQQ